MSAVVLGATALQACARCGGKGRPNCWRIDARCLFAQFALRLGGGNQGRDRSTRDAARLRGDRFNGG